MILRVFVNFAWLARDKGVRIKSCHPLLELEKKSPMPGQLVSPGPAIGQYQQWRELI